MMPPEVNWPVLAFNSDENKQATRQELEILCSIGLNILVSERIEVPYRQFDGVIDSSPLVWETTHFNVNETIGRAVDYSIGTGTHEMFQVESTKNYKFKQQIGFWLYQDGMLFCIENILLPPRSDLKGSITFFGAVRVAPDTEIKSNSFRLALPQGGSSVN